MRRFVRGASIEAVASVHLRPAHALESIHLANHGMEGIVSGAAASTGEASGAAELEHPGCARP
jgi:hypothetical protein